MRFGGDSQVCCPEHWKLGKLWEVIGKCCWHLVNNTFQNTLQTSLGLWKCLHEDIDNFWQHDTTKTTDRIMADSPGQRWLWGGLWQRSLQCPNLWHVFKWTQCQLLVWCSFQIGTSCLGQSAVTAGFALAQTGRRWQFNLTIPRCCQSYAICSCKATLRRFIKRRV